MRDKLYFNFIFSKKLQNAEVSIAYTKHYIPIMIHCYIQYSKEAFVGFAKVDVNRKETQLLTHHLLPMVNLEFRVSWISCLVLCSWKCLKRICILVKSFTLYGWKCQNTFCRGSDKILFNKNNLTRSVSKVWVNFFYSGVATGKKGLFWDTYSDLIGGIFWVLREEFLIFALDIT